MRAECLYRRFMPKIADAPAGRMPTIRLCVDQHVPQKAPPRPPLAKRARTISGLSQAEFPRVYGIPSSPSVPALVVVSLDILAHISRL